MSSGRESGARWARRLRSHVMNDQRGPRGDVEHLLDALGRPWPWNAALSHLLDLAVLVEEAGPCSGPRRARRRAAMMARSSSGGAGPGVSFSRARGPVVAIRVI